VHPLNRPVTDEAIDAYTSYVKDRVSQGLPWKRASEILPIYVQGHPVEYLVEDDGQLHV